MKKEVLIDGVCSIPVVGKRAIVLSQGQKLKTSRVVSVETSLFYNKSTIETLNTRYILVW